MKLATLLTILFCGGTCLNAQVPELKLLMPDGAELFHGGDRVPVLWSGLPAGSTATIEYSTDRGATWQTITDEAVGSKYLWDVPHIESSGCLMRVRATVPAAEGSLPGANDNPARVWSNANGSPSISDVSDGSWGIEQDSPTAGTEERLFDLSGERLDLR